MNFPVHTLPFFVFCLQILCLLPTETQAQTDSTNTWVYIDSIQVFGNRKTRLATIVREMDIAPGDSIILADLPARLESNRLRVLNLGLFTNAQCSVAYWHEGRQIGIYLEIHESWYIYPVPIFELADRNFNVWWKEFDHSLNRANFGVNWYQLNFSGRRDNLRVSANFGYTNLYEAVYTSPSINAGQKLGMQAGISYGRAHEVAYKTEDNKLVFRTDPNDWQITRWQINTGLSWRPGFYTNHRLVLEFHRNSVADSIYLQGNPEFFLSGRSRQQHFSAVYGVSSDHRDVRPYPENGWLGKAELRWNGLLPSDDFHLLRLRVEWKQYHSFSPRWSAEMIGVLRSGYPRRPIPYYNNQALGYGSDFVRGYEYYVADGLDYALLKSSLHLKVFDHTFNLGKMMPLKSYKKVPVRTYLAVNNDFGYANDPFYALGNPLANRWLWGYGLGLDFVILYDKVIKIEWSHNHLNEYGIFLHFDTGI